MRKCLFLLLWATAFTANAKLVSIEDADCSRIKDKNLQAECERIQGKKPKAAIRENNKELDKLFAKINNFEFQTEGGDPPTLTLFPMINPGIEEMEIERAIIEGVYRTFAYTDFDCIRLVITPKKAGNIDRSKEEKLPICKDSAANALSRVFGTSDLKSLVTTNTINGIKFEQWIPSFSSIYYGEKKEGGDTKRHRIVQILRGEATPTPNARTKATNQQSIDNYPPPAVTYNSRSSYSNPKHRNSYDNDTPRSYGGICPPGKTWVSSHSRKGKRVSGYCRKVR
jgi:hypothetical protein